jgi:hypothetical protein
VNNRIRLAATNRIGHGLRVRDVAVERLGPLTKAGQQMASDKAFSAGNEDRALHSGRP